MARDVKTKPTDVDPIAFIDRVENERRRKDAHEILALMQKVTGEPPTMWGPSIVGFGKRRYKYDSGREGDMMLTGFSPRKASLVLYLGDVFDDAALMKKLGKHKHTKGCLYINKLDDIDRNVLRKLVTNAVEQMRKRYSASL
jgi:uncharacterized protein DUF1801